MNTLFTTLPETIQKEVRETLKAFRRVNVTFFNGEYHVETGVYLLASYPADFKSIGEFQDNEVFTPEEMQINYAESFHDFPAGYRGKRDYSIFRGATWETRYQINSDGNLERIGD